MNVFSYIAPDRKKKKKKNKKKSIKKSNQIHTIVFNQQLYYLDQSVISKMLQIRMLF